MLHTPILLICFNRPDNTQKVLKRILEANPHELYIYQDGAREGNALDAVKCQQVRDIIDELTMSADSLTVYKNYSAINLGCGPGPYAAMSWFFSLVEYGIILEDDIDPHPLFWKYMEDLLVRYKNDNRVGMVCGHNLQREYHGNKSYYFTNEMAGTLGWGTWARAWRNFKFDIPYDYEKYEYALVKYYKMPKVLRERSHKKQKMWLSGQRNNCWDYQWDYYLLENGYLNIRPNSCLTSHEGNDGNGTHTYYNPNYYMDVHEERFTPIVHPDRVSINGMVRCKIMLRAVRAFFGNIINKKR